MLLVAFLWLSQNLAHQYLIEGNQKLGSHLYTEANQDFTFAAVLSSFGRQTSADAFSQLGTIAEYREDDALAAYYFEKSLAKKDSDSIRLKYAEHLFVLQKYQEAGDVALKIQKPTDDVYFFLGHNALRQDDFEKAQTYFEKVTAEKYLEHKNEHLSFFALKNHDENFLTLFPEDGDAKFREAAKKALQGKEFTAVQYVQLGNFLLHEGEADFALSFAKLALARENNYRDAFTLEAQSLAARKQYNEAQASLNEAFKTSPLNRDLWNIQAQVYAAQKDYERAFDAYKKSEELGSDTALFHFAFAKVAREDQKFDTALSESQKALTLDAKNDRIYWQFMFWTALDAENFKQMELVASQYVAAHPTEEFGVLAKAFAQYKLQKVGGIGEVLSAINEKNPTSAFARYLAVVTKTDDIADNYKENAKQLLSEAIDYDTNTGTNGEVAKHAQVMLGDL